MEVELVGLGGARIVIKGIVQGVGFRPFVYSLAKQLGLKGWVRNTSAGVEIEVDGELSSLRSFIHAVQFESPPLARIDSIEVTEKALNGFHEFEIHHSAEIEDEFQPVSPDVSICEDCLRELFDPNDRRFLYPFINCTNCGPRFTIIERIPYDRANTTMAGFVMCDDCRAEYNNPLNRRFHAQPIACPACGPQVWLEGRFTEPDPHKAIPLAVNILRQGRIVAIKGLGGVHLACDATNAEAVNALRSRKLRVDKPFAIMMGTLDDISNQCFINEYERGLLLSKDRPIVILQRKPDSIVDPNVAPGQHTLGVMLPYTPLHHLLFYDWATLNNNWNSPPPEKPLMLVMTSGNLSEEPIAKDNEEAVDRLSGIADAFLLHDRPIRTRCDDSVGRVFEVRRPPRRTAGSLSRQNLSGRDIERSRESYFWTPIRRSRGYVPYPVLFPDQYPQVLAVGGELKNVFCLTRGRYAFLSHHIGDLENFETLKAFEDGIAHFESLFKATPEILAHDLHPNYLATRYALDRAATERIPAIAVQHHHAHVAACMADNDYRGEGLILGVSFDGTGYGDDGKIWGGEFLLANYRDYKRVAHLIYAPLPGGEQAIREPWRIALAWLILSGIEWSEDIPPVKYAKQSSSMNDNGRGFYIDLLEVIRKQLTNQINTPLTSSAGRLFDAVASLIGIRHTVNYEAQAAIEMEAAADQNEKSSYSFEISDRLPVGEVDEDVHLIDPTPMFREIVADLRTGTSQNAIAGKFHNTVMNMIAETCRAIQRDYGIQDVFLSGGVWQNAYLLTRTIPVLDALGFRVYTHRQVPSNDGGLALGQAIVAANSVKR